MNPDLITGLMLYFVFLYSTVLHEAGHAWAALKLGDETAYRGGQVSLDPIPHIQREPMGMVIVPIISLFLNLQNGVAWLFGWASAPYDPEWALRYPRRSALMAMAGPASNLLLVVGSGFLIHLGYHLGWFHAVPMSEREFGHVTEGVGDGKLLEFSAMLLSITFSLNLLLMAFNLLPLPPFDGSAIPMFVLSPSAAAAYQNAMRSPGFQLIGFVIAWNGFGYLFSPLHRFAANLLYPGVFYG